MSFQLVLARPPHSLFVRHAKIRIFLCFFARSETRRAGNRTKHNGANGTACFFVLDSGPTNLPFDFAMIGIWRRMWWLCGERTALRMATPSPLQQYLIIHALSLGSNLQARKECSKGARVRLEKIRIRILPRLTCWAQAPNTTVSGGEKKKRALISWFPGPAKPILFNATTGSLFCSKLS